MLVHQSNSVSDSNSKQNGFYEREKKTQSDKIMKQKQTLHFPSYFVLSIFSERSQTQKQNHSEKRGKIEGEKNMNWDGITTTESIGQTV